MSINPLPTPSNRTPAGLAGAVSSAAPMGGPPATTPLAPRPVVTAGGAKADIAKLLDAVIKYDASDLHLTVGRPPAVRVRGELHNLGSTPLTPDDTTMLMKSITSERHQQEVGERGGADFGFAFGEQARFRVSGFKQKGVDFRRGLDIVHTANLFHENRSFRKFQSIDEIRADTFA